MTFDENSVRTSLTEATQWVLEESGIEFPADGIKVEVYENKRGKESIQAKVTYIGPLNLPRRSLQRVKFDLTQDEVIADTTVARSIFHAYDDALEPVCQNQASVSGVSAKLKCPLPIGDCGVGRVPWAGRLKPGEPMNLGNATSK